MRRERFLLRLALVLAMLGIAGIGAAPAASAAKGQLQITTQPALFPAFNQGVSDYVTRCTGSPVQVSIGQPTNTRVSVDNQAYRKGSYTTNVPVNTGQSFRIVYSAPPHTNVTYYVRCLPSDFPTWTVERSGTPQTQWYMVAPSLQLGGFTPSAHYVALFDTNGVPMWWFRDADLPLDVKLLPNGNLAWTTTPAPSGIFGSGFVERRFDGSLVRALKTSSGPPYNVAFDFHDAQLLPNGHYLLQGAYARQADLSSIGGPANATIWDDVVQELTPEGWLVWQWDAYDHIEINEVGQHWRSTILAHPSPYYDVFHMNSVEQTGDNILLSFRHLDAVYDVKRSTGAVVWKLGGEPRNPALPGVQLTILNDIYGGNHFSGQHIARLLADGTVTLHDNQSDMHRPPRAVRFRIDLAAGTARLIEQVTDPAVTDSGCCGSAVKLPTGNWVIDWGLNPYVTELTPAGLRVFRLTFSGLFAYRAFPIPFGRVAATTLRGGMDAQYPR
jgi:hypothetical protein